MTEEKPIIADSGESDYLHIPANRPRHVVFLDETVKRLISVGRLIRFEWITPEEGGSTITVVIKDTNDGNMNTFKGQGPTLGHALRGMLDNVNTVYPLGEEYEQY